MNFETLKSVIIKTIEKYMSFIIKQSINLLNNLLKELH